MGTLHLAVPQDRDGTFSTELFARYQRSEQALVTTLMEMYLQGVSTRNVSAITEALCWDQLLEESGLGAHRPARWRAVGAGGHARWPTTPIRISTVDARYEHVAGRGSVVSQGVFVVAGVRDDGMRELPGGGGGRYGARGEL